MSVQYEDEEGDRFTGQDVDFGVVVSPQQADDYLWQDVRLSLKSVLKLLVSTSNGSVLVEYNFLC